jgi:hypothetical protein
MKDSATITLFGPGESSQEVTVKFYSDPQPRGYLLSEVEVVEPVIIEPTDLETDIKDQLSFQWEVDRVEIEGEVEVEITAESQLYAFKGHLINQ